MLSQVRNRAKEQPMRFPRYADNREIAPAANSVWRNPRFKARCHKDKTELVFCLAFSIPRRLKRNDPAVFHRLFDEKYAGLASALVAAYRRTTHEGKPLKQRVELLLRKMFVEALEILKAKHEDKYGPTSPSDQQQSLHRALIKPGPKKNERKRRKSAIRLAMRYRDLRSQVKELYEIVQTSSRDEESLKTYVEQNLPYDWVRHVTKGKALNNLLPIPGHDARVESLSSKKWTPRQLRVGILVCEELTRDPNCRLGATTIYEKYITLGSRLLKTQK